MMNKLSRIWKYYYLRFKRLRGNPHILALGTAVGVFVGLTPTMPFHTILILLLCLITRGSFIAGVIISWIVCNPLTYFPIYYFSVQIGNRLTSHELNWEDISELMRILLIEHVDFSASIQALMSIGYEALMVLLIGGFIMALPFGILSYYLSFYFFKRMADKRKDKLILK